MTVKMYDLYKVLKKNFCGLDVKNPVPLKKGVTRELVDFSGLDGKLAHYFLKWYRQQERYLRTIKEGRNIYDLHGIIAGAVTKEEELKAKEQIRRLREEYAEKIRAIQCGNDNQSD